MSINLYVAWIAFLLGSIAGAVSGLFFHKAEWLGGYDSWQRRMLRLGHIAFFGLGGVNLAFALSVPVLGIDGVQPASILLIVGVVTMPLICYLSAWRESFRNLFVVPAGSVMIALAWIVYRMAV